MTNYFQAFTANTEGRDFVCGDIHGQWQQLQEALHGIDFDTGKDRFFALGDLVDRGLHSREVFSLLDEPWFYSIRGNHEQLLFDALERELPEDISMWQLNGGDAWARSISELTADTDFMNLLNKQRVEMPWVIEVVLKDGRKLGLVHAEVPIPSWQEFSEYVQGDDSLAGQLRFDSLWSRKIQVVGYDSAVEGIDLCVHGHCMFQEPVRQFNRCYIDTGAYVVKKSLFGLKQQRVGCLSVFQLEDLFSLPESTMTQIRQKRIQRR